MQMLSAWIAERGLHCTMNIGMWRAQGVDEPAAWGTLLADVVRHLAAGTREETGAEPSTTVQAIVEALLEELGEPTSQAEGGFHPGNT
ncbi:DUF5076 domain-containing protein [Caenimonas sp. S4]|nr:DUF5076 domain-containing protein [Caenimonas soli]